MMKSGSLIEKNGLKIKELRIESWERGFERKLKTVSKVTSDINALAFAFMNDKQKWKI